MPVEWCHAHVTGIAYCEHVRPGGLHSDTGPPRSIICATPVDERGERRDNLPCNPPWLRRAIVAASPGEPPLRPASERHRLRQRGLRAIQPQGLQVRALAHLAGGQRSTVLCAIRPLRWPHVPHRGIDPIGKIRLL